MELMSLKRCNTFEKYGRLATITCIIFMLILVESLDRYQDGNLAKNRSLLTFIPYFVIVGYLLAKYSGIFKLGQAEAYVLKSGKKTEIVIMELFFGVIILAAIIAVLLVSNVSKYVVFHVLIGSLIFYYYKFFNIWWSIREKGICTNICMSWASVINIGWSEQDKNLLKIETKRRSGYRSIKMRVPPEDRKKVIEQIFERFPEIDRDL
ncbi:MAG: hypothetical protein ACYC57_05210 [Thermoleophilia bacterium]